MAQTFDNELTLYFWFRGDRHYPEGHAAFRLRNEGHVAFENWDDGEMPPELEHLQNQRDVLWWRSMNKNPNDVKKYQEFNDQYTGIKSQIAQRRQSQEKIGHTATAKVKIPFIKTAGLTWGLMPLDLQNLLEVRRRHTSVGLSSFQLIATFLKMFRADGYAPLPYRLEMRGWDAVILQRWAEAIRTRVDELNRISKEFEIFFQIEHGKGRQSNLETGNKLITSKEWLSSSKKGGLLRSSHLQRIDSLIAAYHNSPDQWQTGDKLRIVAEILDACVAYRKQQSGSRSEAVNNLGMHVIQLMRSTGGWFKS